MSQITPLRCVNLEEPVCWRFSKSDSTKEMCEQLCLRCEHSFDCHFAVGEGNHEKVYVCWWKRYGDEKVLGVLANGGIVPTQPQMLPAEVVRDCGLPDDNVSSTEPVPVCIDPTHRVTKHHGIWHGDDCTKPCTFGLGANGMEAVVESQPPPSNYCSCCKPRAIGRRTCYECYRAAQLAENERLRGAKNRFYSPLRDEILSPKDMVLPEKLSKDISDYLKQDAVLDPVGIELRKPRTWERPEEVLSAKAAFERMRGMEPSLFVEAKTESAQIPDPGIVHKEAIAKLAARTSLSGYWRVVEIDGDKVTLESESTEPFQPTRYISFGSKETLKLDLLDLGDIVQVEWPDEHKTATQVMEENERRDWLTFKTAEATLDLQAGIDALERNDPTLQGFHLARIRMRREQIVELINLHGPLADGLIKGLWHLRDGAIPVIEHVFLPETLNGQRVICALEYEGWPPHAWKPKVLADTRIRILTD